MVVVSIEFTTGISTASISLFWDLSQGAASSVRDTVLSLTSPSSSPPKSFVRPRKSSPHRHRHHVGRQIVASLVHGRLDQI